MAQARRPPALAGTPERMLFRRSDGVLYDAADRRRVGLDELRQEVRAGGVFRVQDRATGCDCTFQVLAAVIGSAAPAPMRRLLDTVSVRTPGGSTCAGSACPRQRPPCTPPEDGEEPSA